LSSLFTFTVPFAALFIYSYSLETSFTAALLCCVVSFAALFIYSSCSQTSTADRPLLPQILLLVVALAALFIYSYCSQTWDTAQIAARIFSAVSDVTHLCITHL
jgi:hypothetical protein